MLQINFDELTSDDYLQTKQEEFAKDFALEDADLTLALAAYCFYNIIPDPPKSLTRDDLPIIQLLNARQYTCTITMKKLKPYPKLIELANALSEIVFASYNEDSRTIMTLQAAFESIPADIRARYKTAI